MCVQNHSNPSNLIGSTTPLSCQVTSVLLLSHSNIPWNFGCGHGPSRSKARKANTICPKKTQLKKNNKKCTFYEDLVFHVAWGIWFFGIPQICLWKMSPASPMMWMFTLDKEFLKPGLRRSSFTSHKDFYLFKCCFLDAKTVQQTVPLRSIDCSLTIHSGKWYRSAFNWRPAHRWNYQLWNPKQGIASLLFWFFPRTAFLVARRIFNNLTACPPGGPCSSTTRQCHVSCWRHLHHQAMVQGQGAPRRKASLQLAVKKQTFWLSWVMQSNLLKFTCWDTLSDSCPGFSI